MQKESMVVAAAAGVCSLLSRKAVSRIHFLFKGTPIYYGVPNKHPETRLNLEAIRRLTENQRAHWWKSCIKLAQIEVCHRSQAVGCIGTRERK